MANITGTNGNNTLVGTVADDIIKGLGGNDLILASDGNDTIDGGSGNDTVDYSSRPEFISTNVNSNGSLKVQRVSNSFEYSFNDTLTNVETIIGNAKNRNTISGENTSSVDIDLSKNRFTYSSPTGSKTLTVKNFSSIIGTDGNDRIKGNDLDNSISSGAGDDVIIGSKGNDTIFGNGLGVPKYNQTLDYSNLGGAVKFLGGSVDKGAFGFDNVVNGVFKKIIGATNKKNTIDASNFTSDQKLEVNLATNSIQYFVSPSRFTSGYTLNFDVTNFVNVIGSKFNDNIVGGNKNSQLDGGDGNDIITGGNGNDIITGGDGNDTINGGNGNDIITGGNGSDIINGGNGNDRINGTDAIFRGAGTVDTLTGGGGRDTFVLGDKNGAYYVLPDGFVGDGNSDYALITDFDLFKDSIDLGGFKNYSFASAGNNTIELYSGKDVNTRDLIAKIQLTGGISNRSTNSRSVMGADANLNAITSKIDILSGSSSAADA